MRSFAAYNIEHRILPKIENCIGLDLAINDLLIASDGARYENSRILQEYERKRTRLQRQPALNFT